MLKRRGPGLLLAVLLLVIASSPVLAAPVVDDGGGVRFGPYTLEAGGYVAGDLVVFGGPVKIMEGAELDGDLVVFGPFEIEADARIDGQLVVMGTADIAGIVEGDVFTAGSLTLRSSARLEGDVTSTGVIDRREGAVVLGEVSPFSEDEIVFPEGIPFPFTAPVRVSTRPWWVRMLGNWLRGFVRTVVLTMLALVANSLWPDQTERMGRVIEENTLTTFGAGLLGLIVAGLLILLLALTICLSPFALVGAVVVAVAMLLGWVSLGLILGRRVLTDILRQPAPRVVVAGVFGTALLSLLMALARPFGLLHALLIFVFIPPAVGSVILTRFGSRPYATAGRAPQGHDRPAPPVTPQPSRPPEPPEAGSEVDVSEQSGPSGTVGADETESIG